jgi:chromosome segregation ATPase
MDLGLQSEEYVKGEVLATTQRILKAQMDHGHIPSKSEYIQPTTDDSESKVFIPDLLPVLSSFSEEFKSITRMIENNFKLHSEFKPSPNAITLREEIENCRKKISELEKELQNSRNTFKSPEKREWVITNRELLDCKHQLELSLGNVQRLKMEKINLESKNIEHQQIIEDMKTRLKTLNDSVFPRLEDLEKVQEEIMTELKKIKQDADLLPEMFRNEVKLKKTIREEKLFAEERMNKALEELDQAKKIRAKIEQERDRKERISLQAIAAKNMIDVYLKEANAKMEIQNKTIAESNSQIEKLSKESEYHRGQFLELQEHMYILNNRINELEDQKKALIDQLKSMGVQSRAHYVHRRLEKP